jgi:hypothetical protein
MARLARLTTIILGVVAAVLLAPRSAEGLVLNPTPSLGSTYSHHYITGGLGSYPPTDGTLSNATFCTLGWGKVTVRESQYMNKPRGAVDPSGRLWVLDSEYLRVVDFAGDSVTSVFPALGAPLNVISCNGTFACGAISVCGADAGWTTLFISAWTAPGVVGVNGGLPYYGIIALDMTTWAWTLLPLPNHPWDCVVNATSPTSGTIYLSINGGIQTLDLATLAVADLTLIVPADVNSYAAGTNFADGPLASAVLGPLSALALGDGAQLYLADALNYCIRRLDTAARTVVTISGDPTAPPQSISDTCGTTTLAPVAVASASWSRPMSVVWDSARQRLYVVCALVM